MTTLRLAWTDALDWAGDRIGRSSGRTTVVGITGPVAAGKSTFALRLLGAAAEADGAVGAEPCGANTGTDSHVELDGLGGEGGEGGGVARPRTVGQRPARVILSTDQYLPDYDGLAEQERDRPEHADLARLAADLARLRAGLAAMVPVWSFHSHRREGEIAVASAPVIVVEGIHALHERVRADMDLRIFIEASATARWARWEAIEASGIRGWGVEKAKRYFETVAEPTFSEREAEYRRCADVIVINE